MVPNGSESRHDVIQSVELGSARAMVAFCRGIQAAAPVDSYVTPVPYPIPGYNCDVIMAAGAFVQGASIELSADAPICEPYIAYLQGGVIYDSAKIGILKAVDAILENKE